MAVVYPNLFHYNPSLVAAIVFVVLFVLITFAHVWRMIRARTWFLVPLVIGGFFEWIGYIGCVFAAEESPNWTLAPYIIQSLFILLAPALFAASIYVILGRIIRHTDGDSRSPVKAKWLTWVFVTSDVITFLTQSQGGGLLAKADAKSQKAGEYIIIAGISLQTISFALFMVVACIFHRRMTLAPTTRSQQTNAPWQRHLVILYVASSLILIRSIFRIVEYVTGSNGPLQQTEIYFYVFDAALMFLLMLMLVVQHPSSIFHASTKKEGLEMESSGTDSEEGFIRADPGNGA